MPPDPDQLDLDLLARIPLSARTVLDIGCGNGSLTAAWANGGWDVTGVDSSESGIVHTKASYPNIAFHRMPVGSELVEHFGEGCFDAIVSAEVVEHLQRQSDEFFGGRPVGEILNWFSTDVDRALDGAMRGAIPPETPMWALMPSAADR